MDNLLIIGASSGVGQALAKRLLGSHNIWTASRRSSDPNSDNRQVEWDATKDDFPADFLPEQLNGFVYCPGSIRLQPFDRLSETSFREDFEVNLMGAVRALKMALPALKAAPQASVVLFSTVAVATGMPMHASIAAAKGAVEGLTRSLAAEFAPRVRVNAIAPSLTDTPLAGKLLRTEKQRTAAGDRHPLERIGEPDDLAAVAAFLLSDAASWMTGQVIAVDGGLGSLRRFG
jgi:NAD(P)-dependent dehydrogenase (short-subunit alcohol dehydrogenase family)